jgi:pimeloyl-ACP methyl ester carboxylesterase
MEKMTRTLLIGSGLAAVGVAAAAGVTHAASAFLVRIALDRDGVESYEKRFPRITGSLGDMALLRQLEYLGSQLESKCSEVRMMSRDGLMLVGHWRGCDEPKRVIIAMHGWRSGWAKDFGMIADFWHDNHCIVLYPEQRGHGKSEGHYIGFGLLERHDCRQWIDWVNRKTGGSLPIYLAGVSMGASTVMMTAGMELPENVHGIIADCGFTSPDAIWSHVARNNLHLYYGLHKGLVDANCKKRIHIGAREYSTLDAMADCTVPVLFIHGTDDRFVPVQMTYDNYKACAAPKHLFVVPGATHGTSYRDDKAGYEKTVLNFFSMYDKKTPAG